MYTLQESVVLALSSYQIAGCCQPKQDHIKGLEIRLPDSVFFIDKH